MTWFDLQQEIFATLRENIAKSRPTLLVGPLGIGKSHISPIKPALLNLAQLLHQGGALEVEGIEAS